MSVSSNAPRASYAGVLSGLAGSAFGLCAIFSFALLFLPFAILFSLVSLLRSVGKGSAAGFCACAASSAFTAIGFVVSPSAWIATAALFSLVGNEQHQAADRKSQTALLPVDPPSAANLIPIQLHDLVYMLLPDENGQRTWNKVGVGKILWSRHSEALSGGNYRITGLARVRVGNALGTEGTSSTAKPNATGSLLRSRQEVAWRITIDTHKHNEVTPDSISIDPFCVDNDAPLQTGGCAFQKEDLTSSHLYVADNICNQSIKIDPNYIGQVWRISAQGKKPMLLVYTSDAGSGGRSSSVELADLTRQDEECRPATQ